LYILLDNRTVVYEKVAGSPSGRPFHVQTAVPDIERWQPAEWGTPRLYEVRCELVDVASKLDVRARPFGFRAVTGDGADGRITVNGRETRADDCLSRWEPLVDCPTVDDLDRDGAMRWFQLPDLSWWIAQDESVYAEVLRQVKAMVIHLQHHAAIIGWRWPTKAGGQGAALNRQVQALVTSLDETRSLVLSNGSTH
jgi:hypothetical protein